MTNATVPPMERICWAQESTFHSWDIDAVLKLVGQALCAAVLSDSRAQALLQRP